MNLPKNSPQPHDNGTLLVLGYSVPMKPLKERLKVISDEIVKSYNLGFYPMPSEKDLLTRVQAWAKEIEEIPIEAVPRVFKEARKKGDLTVARVFKTWKELMPAFVDKFKDNMVHRIKLRMIIAEFIIKKNDGRFEESRNLFWKKNSSKSNDDMEQFISYFGELDFERIKAILRGQGYEVDY